MWFEHSPEVFAMIKLVHEELRQNTSTWDSQNYALAITTVTSAQVSHQKQIYPPLFIENKFDQEGRRAMKIHKILPFLVNFVTEMNCIGIAM